jgi:hypothetical protein
MKKRIVGLVYIFPFLTGGVYFIYWILSIVYEINQYFKEEKIKFKLLLMKFAMTFIAYLTLLSIIILINGENKLFFILFFLCFAFAIYWFYLIISTLLKIVKYVFIIQELENIEPKINKEFCLVMFLIYFIGIIILQYNINKIATKQINNIK